jgi:manganese transport protein
VFAQVANGILLPAMAIFLLAAVNDGRRMGEMANGRLLNLLGGAVVLVTLIIGITAIVRALGS